MKTVLLTGATGQLGRELSQLDWGQDLQLFTPSRSQLDLLSEPSISAAFEARGIAAVINAAAYTAVDQAEDDVAAAYAVNAVGPGLLAAACARRGLPLIQLSTDYVFSGAKAEPYQEDDQPDPISVYGASKLAGEVAALAANPRTVIVRTAWLFSRYGQNFVKTMRRLARAGGSITVVSDQLGCPTAAGDVAVSVLAILRRQMDDPAAPVGVYHLVNAGQASWWDLATAALADFGCAVEPIPTMAYPTRALRPADSRLSNAKVTRDFGLQPRPWRQALDEVLNALQALERRAPTAAEATNDPADQLR